MNKNDKIFIAGHRGLVGSAIVRKFKISGFSNLILKAHNELDLTNQAEVQNFFKIEKPDYVILAAAKVGGIYANNTYPADFIYQNMMIEANVIHSAYMSKVKRLLFLGSSCIYPKNSKQPIHESSLLTGALEQTNESYAIAKIAGIKMCESYNRQFSTDFRSIMPTNLYGPNDNFHLENSHVVPALIRKFHLAKCIELNNWDSIIKDISRYPINSINKLSSKGEILKCLSSFGICADENVSVDVWGSGDVRREFLFVDDMADSVEFILNLSREKYKKMTTPILSHLNIGTGKDKSIKETAEIIKKIIGFNGRINFDKYKPEGPKRKLLDTKKINELGWGHKTSFSDGIKETYKWYKLSIV